MRVLAKNFDKQKKNNTFPKIRFS